MKLRGRYWLTLWLAVFLVVAAAVALRQRQALDTARALDEARSRRSALEAEQTDLLERIRSAESREVLTEKVIQNLGLRFAADSEIVFLAAPTNPEP